NHFIFGHQPEERRYQTRTSAEQTFFAKYGPIQKSLSSWRQSNALAAHKIRASTTEDLWILYSGGVDSECCLLTFLQEGIEVKVAILELEDGINAHDVRYAHEFCKKHSLQPEVFKMNVFDYWRSQEFYQLVDPIH